MTKRSHYPTSVPLVDPPLSLWQRLSFLAVMVIFAIGGSLAFATIFCIFLYESGLVLESLFQ